MARKAFIMASNGPESMGRLNYAEKDAEEFGKKLQSFRYGFEVITAKRGSDPFEILRLLGNTALQCERDDDFICYFSGHGDLAKGKLQLVLSDEPKPIELISLDVDFIQNFIQRCRSKNKLLILDCCHSGGAVGMKSGGGDKLLEEITPFNDNDNHLVLVASERLSKIREYDDLKGSFLTRKICEALDEQFNIVDKDRDQRISITDIMEYLQTNRTLYNKSKSVDKKAPLPFIFGQQKGSNFYLTQEKYRWTPVELNCLDGSKLVITPIPSNKNRCLFISKYPVTNAQYKEFVIEGHALEPKGRYLLGQSLNGELEWETNFEPWKDERFNNADLPVVCVSYNDALKYCEWLENKGHAWLNSLPVASLKAVFIPPAKLWNMMAYGVLFLKENYGDSHEWIKQVEQIHDKDMQPISVYDDGTRTNSRGVTDMLGNVWEWCAEEIWFNLSINRRYRGNPVIKGGGFHDDLSSANFIPTLDASFITRDSRVSPRDFKSYDLGIRVAGTVDIAGLPEEVQLRLSLCPPVDDRFWYDIDNYKLSGEDLLR